MASRRGQILLAVFCFAHTACHYSHSGTFFLLFFHYWQTQIRSLTWRSRGLPTLGGMILVCNPAPHLTQSTSPTRASRDSTLSCEVRRLYLFFQIFFWPPKFFSLLFLFFVFQIFSLSFFVFIEVFFFAYLRRFGWPHATGVGVAGLGVCRAPSPGLVLPSTGHCQVISPEEKIFICFERLFEFFAVFFQIQTDFSLSASAQTTQSRVSRSMAGAAGCSHFRPAAADGRSGNVQLAVQFHSCHRRCTRLHSGQKNPSKFGRPTGKTALNPILSSNFFSNFSIFFQFIFPFFPIYFSIFFLHFFQIFFFHLFLPFFLRFIFLSSYFSSNFPQVLFIILFLTGWCDRSSVARIARETENVGRLRSTYGGSWRLPSAHFHSRVDW